MSMRGLKIKKDLLKAACLLAPTMEDESKFREIVQRSEDKGEDESQTVRRLVAAINRGVNFGRWPREYA